MTLIGKISALALAGGMVAAMTSPSLAAWVVVKGAEEGCTVMEESAEGAGEMQIAGPFDTEEEADQAAEEHADCIVRN